MENFISADIIFNATPVGMFPNNYENTLIDLSLLPNLVSVIDVIYNPLHSKLLVEAKKEGIQVVNGLLMLLYQAVKSIELFHNIKISDKEVQSYYKKLLLKQANIVFIGMPMSGKSLYGRLFARDYDKRLVDIDHEIERQAGQSIEDIFELHGESYFRELEFETIKKFSKYNNQAISCGGGVILNNKNIEALQQNGIIVFIDISLELLKTCNPKNRPLLQNKDNLIKLFHDRHKLYKKYADITINKTHFDKDKLKHEIEVKINEYIGTKWT